MADPLERSHPVKPSPLSLETFHIAGILTDVYGMQELTQDCDSIACLWLLHPRNGKKERMADIASSCITEWQNSRPADSKIGLIAVAFDQRNHGTRVTRELANDSWREGNELHAQDMFSVYHGTAIDLSLLIDHLPSYIFHKADAPPIQQHLVLGVSLGGHAAWQIFFQEPRVTAAVVIIGCPDYASIMKDRARLSKRKTYLSSDGADFFGSEDFPSALVSSVCKWDPKGQLFGLSEIPKTLTESDQKRLRAAFDAKIKNKRILLCSGGADKLVPYHCGESFIKTLKSASNDWYKDGNVEIEDIIYPGIGHKCSPEMVRDSARFVTDFLAKTTSSAKFDSKI